MLPMHIVLVEGHLGDSAQSSDIILHSPPLGFEPIKVVVHYADGRVTKGSTHDFYPNKPNFHLFPAAPEPSIAAIAVQMKDLKALFFVRDLTGNDYFVEAQKSCQGKQPPGRRVEVTLSDGHVLVGTTLGYDPRRPASSSSHQIPTAIR